MKPIILNINEMSESVEAYEAKPKKAVIYTIYTLFALLLVAVVWAYFFKIEISVDSDGLIKIDEKASSIPNSEKYSAEIYVDNKDIADIKKGQKVQYEMLSFPSRDYGEFSGTIEEISKDLRIDEKDGKAYYLVRATFDMNVIRNKDKKINLMNEMLCRAKVITRKESVLDYLLNELNLKE